MNYKDKIKCLEHWGFKIKAEGEVIKVCSMTKILDNYNGIRRVLIEVYFNKRNNHFLFSCKRSFDTNNIFVGRIETEEFLIQVLQAIYVIPIQKKQTSELLTDAKNMAEGIHADLEAGNIPEDLHELDIELYRNFANKYK